MQQLIILAFWAILFTFNVRAAPPAQDDLIVDLQYSKYQGTALSNGVNQWLGIRFAAPPLGNLRFRAPQDPLFNRTLQIADAHGPICLPTPSTSLSTTASEDCLFLDIYAPADTSTLHPVFIFIQGGGLNADANPNLNGSSLIVASDLDIVVVTFNYRVGPWGFLTSQEIVADGDLNVGLKDQRKVFEWVQQYISLFGGDPNHVTIGGDSAGAASVDLQLSAYGGRNDGLFHAAAAESQSFGAQLTVEQSQYQYNALVERTGCNTSANTLQCLRDLDVSVITDNNIVIPTPGGAGGNPVYMYSNVIDGDFTQDYTYNAYAQGKFIKVPVIFGDDTNEGTIFTPTYINNYTQMNNFLVDNWVQLTASDLAEIDFLYPEGAQYPNTGAYWSAACDAYGEIRYICPGIFLSSIFSDYDDFGDYDDFDDFSIGSSWNYHWDVLDPANAISGYGVTHTAELASIWGYSSSPDSLLIPTIQSYWTSFIRSYNPNTYRLPGSPLWTPFNNATKMRMHFPNNVSEVAMETVPLDQASRCAFLSSIGPFIAQ